MSNLVKYGSFDLDELEKKEKELSGAAGGNFIRPQVGKTVVRFLPPKAGVKSPFQIVYEHFIQPGPGQKKIRFSCPKRMEGKRCPACEKADSLRRTQNPADRERAYSLYPSKRIYANVIDRANPDEGPKVMPFGVTIFDALKSIRAEDGDFTNPEADGFDIVILREGTKKHDTRYEVRPDRKDSPLGNMEWIEQQWDLSKYARVDTLEEILAKMSGQELDNKPPVTVIDVPVKPRLSAPLADHLNESASESEDDIPY